VSTTRFRAKGFSREHLPEEEYEAPIRRNREEIRRQKEKDERLWREAGESGNARRPDSSRAP
jgi:hypothetical protein